MMRPSSRPRDARSSFPPAEGDRREAVPRSARLPRLKILVIDDSEVVLQATQAQLEACGFEVSLCDSPIGAAMRAAREQPDLILVDLDMASMPGDRVITSLKTGPRTARIPICIYTGADQRQAMAVARRARADGVIEKGCDEKTLLTTIRRALRT